MSRILLLPHGTTGDVLPYIWIGRQMRERGHQVTLVWAEEFRAFAGRAGLGFVALEDDGFQQLIENPVLWRPHDGMKLSNDYAGRCTAKYVNAALTNMACHGRADLLVAPLITYGARVLREKLGIPLISAHVHPFQFMSAHEVPSGIPAATWLRRLPICVRKALMNAAAPYDRFAMPHLIECCREHGVKPPRRLRDWWHSPDGVLALFPEWFARPQPDWPANTLQWNFPLDDPAVAMPLDRELAAFLSAGEKPVVFTLGSGHLHSRQFYEDATTLTVRLGCRAIFVTRDKDQTPSALPPGVFVTTFAPFGTLLPLARACVHHGGIGTTALCFQAGLPQLIIPMAIDQPDNAERVERLGAGLQLPMPLFTVERALPLLQRCMEDANLRQNAAACEQRLRDKQPVEKLVSWLESKCAKS